MLLYVCNYFKYPNNQEQNVILRKVDLTSEIQLTHKQNRHLITLTVKYKTLGYSGVVANNLSVKPQLDLSYSLEFDQPM